MYFNFVFPVKIIHCYQSNLAKTRCRKQKKTFCKSAVKPLEVLVTKLQERSPLKSLIIICCS